MSQRIPYDEPPRKRGRRPGGKNKPGHKAGRPSNGNDKHGAAVPRQGSSLPTGKDPGRPHSQRIPYDTPTPCTDGHNCPGNGNGNGNRMKITSPVNLPAKPLPSAPVGYNAMRSICQSGENPELITPDELIREIQRIAQFDIRMLYDEFGCPLPLNKLCDEAAAAIASYSAAPLTYEGRVLLDPRDPEGKTPLYRTSVSCWNKNTAQDQLARWHGLYAKDKTPTNINAQFNQYNLDMGDGLDYSLLTDEELEALERLQAKACRGRGGEILDLEAGPDGLGDPGL